MKTIKTAAAIMLATSLFFLACDKNKQKLPVDFKYVLLDTLGNEKTVFSPGENIIFSFQVINESDERLFLNNFFPNDDFFRVYQVNSAEGNLNHGVPYTGYTQNAGFFIDEHKMLEIKYPWNSIDNWNTEIVLLFGDNDRTNLPVGSYYSEFTQTFEIGDIKTEEKHFKINFTIE